MSRKLKTGVVGAGVFGSFHAEKHSKSGRAALAGVYDVDGERASALAGRLGVETYSSFEALLNDVDAAVIASPAVSHYRLARQALEAGRHVYIEKPLALTLAEADSLIALAAEKSLVLQVGHQERFILEALGLPSPDRAPFQLEFSRCGPPTGRGEDVSVVFDLMIHDLDIARLFGFRAPQRVSACGDGDETIATLWFEEGRSCSFIASRRMDARRRLLKVVDADGEFEIDFSRRIVTGESDHREAFADPLQKSVDSFIASALDGAATAISGAAGRGALEWAIMIEEAREDLNAPAARRRIA